ncbi:putative integral membrane protein [Sinomonas atrocyanea]|uniref:LapA family protein n=1 Tax=Sinomonas atrocyanea TaxID=37927 RepID=UPI00278AD45C|nr:lipopolysaccharide assembly protein LapA domain-containing protein [Sinomonas atrocyanea]MDQ0261084.1 putative integral membrane protein [Sinomonas atrocyanea]
MSTDPAEGHDVTRSRVPEGSSVPPPSARPASGPASETPPSGVSEERPGRQGVSRAGATWTAVIAGLVVFILLVVFFIQNQDMVQVHFLGLIGPVPLGLALFIAAVAGGVLVAIAGAIRIIQLRAAARRARRTTPPGR